MAPNQNESDGITHPSVGDSSKHGQASHRIGVLTLSSSLSPPPRGRGVWGAGQSCPQRRAGNSQPLFSPTPGTPASSALLPAAAPLNSPGNSFHKSQVFPPQRAQPRSGRHLSLALCPAPNFLGSLEKGKLEAQQLAPEDGEEEGEQQKPCWHLQGHSWHRGAECTIWRLPRRL